MKKVISLALLGATTSLMAMYAEQAYLYKDPRIIGMGGANVAVGAYSTSVFSNPAGLTNIKKEHGYVVDLLGVGISASDRIRDFMDDLDDVEDDDTEAMTDVLDKYNGKHFHLGLSNYSSVSKNSDMFAWSIGILTASDVNLMSHANGSSEGGLLGTTSRVYGGIVLGGAKPYETKYGRFDVGVGLKYITQKSYEGVLTVSELVDNGDEDIADTLQKKYEKKASGIGLDLGVTYHPFQDSSWHPVFGLSILNIGSMNMDDNYGGQPLTVNIGASVTPEVPYIEKLVIALDYVDLFNANKLRMYEINEVNNQILYTDYATSDFMKNVRLGVGVGLIDSTYFSATLNLGLYQSSYTAGLDMMITVLRLNFATYEEQVGTGSVDISDRRYLAQIGIGW